MPFYLPIPLCVGLFWVAIFQMNRAQRQLLFLTNQFHHDHYIESLLLVINNISFNALDGAEKIRTIVEKMIEGYIHFGNNVVEKHINEEIEKDKINLLSLFHLMEKAKGLFAVSK
jgi:TRAP-type C4-dicarboxylate transport system substrate-binding protein